MDIMLVEADTTVEARVRGIVSRIAVATLGMSPRTVEALRVAGLRTVGDLLPHSQESLLALRGLGRKGAREIRERLASLGLSLEETTPTVAPPADRAHRTVLSDLAFARLLDGRWEHDDTVAAAIGACLAGYEEIWLQAGVRRSLASLRELAFSAHAEAADDLWRARNFGAHSESSPRRVGYWDAVRGVMASRLTGLQRFACNWETEWAAAAEMRLRARESFADVARVAEIWVMVSNVLVASADRAPRGESRVEEIEESLFGRSSTLPISPDWRVALERALDGLAGAGDIAPDERQTLERAWMDCERQSELYAPSRLEARRTRR